MEMRRRLQEGTPSQEATGKRQRSAPTVNAATSPNNPNHLLYVHDYKHKRKWLVDGGAVLSIIPPTLAQRARGPTNTQLQAANGTKIKCYGVQKMVITMNCPFK